MQHNIAGIAGIHVYRLAHLGQINLAIRGAMRMEVIMMIRANFRMMMIRTDFMRMRSRPGHRSEPGEHGNQQDYQSVPHRPSSE